MFGLGCQVLTYQDARNGIFNKPLRVRLEGDYPKKEVELSSSRAQASSVYTFRVNSKNIQ
jgi:hypothetical protein